MVKTYLEFNDKNRNVALSISEIEIFILQIIDLFLLQFHLQQKAAVYFRTCWLYCHICPYRWLVLALVRDAQIPVIRKHVIFPKLGNKEKCGNLILGPEIKIQCGMQHHLDLLSVPPRTDDKSGSLSSST